MTHQNPVPVQVMRRDTFVRPDHEGQSYATRAWNLATSLYYKPGMSRGGQPTFRQHLLIGISFHHLKRREGEVVYASVAQRSRMRSNLRAKGSTLPHDQRRDRQPYLQEKQAADLMKDVLDKYQDLAVSCHRVSSCIRRASISRGRAGFREAQKIVCRSAIWSGCAAPLFA